MKRRIEFNQLQPYRQEVHMQPIVKSITITLLLLVLATGAWGVGSQTINYQGYLRNTAGAPVP